MSQTWNPILYMGTGPTGSTGPSPPGNYYFAKGTLTTAQSISTPSSDLPDNNNVIKFTPDISGDPQNWCTNAGTSTFRVTPTIAGYYQIDLKVTWDISGTADTVNNQIYINNTGVSNVFIRTSTTNPVTTNTTTIQYLNGSSDIIQFSAYTGTAGLPLLATSATYFSVTLLQGGTSTTPTTGKTFIIDHPLDPTRHLVHACIEGPEIGVYYRGEATLQQESVAIHLPNYVPTLATDFTVQITPIYEPGQPIKTYATTKVVHGTFEVYGPPGSFYWLVNASRGSIVTEPLKSQVTVHGSGPYKWIS